MPVTSSPAATKGRERPRRAARSAIWRLHVVRVAGIDQTEQLGAARSSGRSSALANSRRQLERIGPGAPMPQRVVLHPPTPLIDLGDGQLHDVIGSATWTRVGQRRVEHRPVRLQRRGHARRRHLRSRSTTADAPVPDPRQRLTIPSMVGWSLRRWSSPRRRSAAPLTPVASYTGVDASTFDGLLAGASPG